MANNNYRIILDAKLNTTSIENELKSLAGKYSLVFNVKVNAEGVTELKQQIGTIQNSIKNTGKVTFIDAAKDNQSLLELQRRIEDIKRTTGETAKFDIFTSLNENGEKIQRAVVTYTDGMGKARSETLQWVTATQQEGNELKKTSTWQLTNVKYSDNLAKVEKERLKQLQRNNAELKKGVQYSKEFLSRAKDLKSGDTRVVKGKDLAQKIQVAAQNGDVAKVRELSGQLHELDASIRQSGNSLYSWGKEMGIAISRTITWATSIGLVYGVLQQFRDGVGYIKELNKEMTNIQLLQVDGAKNNEQIANLAQNYNKLAQEMGATTVEVAKGSTEWMRQGKTIQEAQDLTRSSIMLSKLAAMDSADATEYLTAILNGFKMSAADSTTVVDKLVAVDNVAATSAAELAEALQRTSNIAQMAGVDFDRLVGYVATVSDVTRKSASTIGESFKTIFTRMQNIKLGNLDEDGASINDVEKALARVDIKLRDSETNFRDMDDVLSEVAGKWATFNDVQKASIAQAIAGTRQYENLIVLLNNWDKQEKLHTTSLQASGTAMQRYAIYQQSVEASSKRMQAAMEEMWQKSMNPRMISLWYDTITAVIKLISTLGGLPPILMVVGGLLVALNGQAVVGAISGLITSIRTVITTLFAAQTAAVGFGVELAVATGGITAAIGLIVVLVNAFGQSAEKTAQKISDLQNEVKTLQENLKKSVGEKEEFNKLWKEFEALSKITNKTAVESQRYYEIMQRIKDIMPNVNGYYDEQGRFILATTQAINDLNTAKDKEIENEQKLLHLKSQESFQSRIKGYQQELDKLKTLDNKLAVSQGRSDPISQWFMNTFQGGTEVIKNQLEQQKIAIDKYIQDIKNDYSGMTQDQQKEMVAYLNTLGDQGKAVLAIINKDQEDAYVQWAKNLMNGSNLGGQAIDNLTDKFKSLFDTLKTLQDESKTFYELVGKSFDGKFNFDDVNTLLQKGSEYIEYLKVEEGRIELNTDLVRNKQIADAEAARDKVQEAVDVGKASQKELDIMNNYVEQVKSAIPVSREFVNTFQDMMKMSGSQMKGGISDELHSMFVELDTASQQFEDGKISAKSYFDEIHDNISKIDMSEQFKNNQDSAQIFFSGLTLDSMQALGQLNSDFNTGKITVADYTDSLGSLSGVFEALGSMAMSEADSLGIPTEQANAMRDAVTGALGDISAGQAELTQLQAANTAVQQAWYQMTNDNLKFGTDAYNQTMMKVAQAAEKSGYVYQDTTGKAYKSAGDIYKYLIANQGNFDKYSTGLANKTGNSISKVVSGAGKLLETLGNAIKSFHAELKFGVKSIDWGEVDVMGHKLPIPNVTFTMDGSVTGMDAIGTQIAKYGQDLQKEADNIDLDSSIYQIPEANNQVSDTAKGAASAYDDLGQAIKDAGSAAKDAAKDQKEAMNDLLDRIKHVKDEEKSRLKDQLDNYKKIIDQRKKLLDSMEKEQEYQDQVAEKQKSIGDLQVELQELSLDDSEEAQAKRLQLQEELAKQQKDLEDTQRKKSIDDQKSALDDEYSNFKDEIDKRVSAIDDFVKDLGLIKADNVDSLVKAIAEMGFKVNTSTGAVPMPGITDYTGQGLGSGGSYDITKWLGNTKSFGSGSGGTGFKNWQSYNKDSGTAFDTSNSLKNPFDKLGSDAYTSFLRGSELGNFSSIPTPYATASSVPNGTSNLGSSFNIEKALEIVVQGNLDGSVIPDIDRISKKVIEQINKIMIGRGYIPKTNNNSI